MSALERLGAWIASEDEQPGPVLALHVADAVGAWIAGRGIAEGRVIAALPADDLAARVGRHCACARLSEIDDIHLASATTPGGVIVPAAVTVAASVGADAAALARAVDAGYEAMTRLGRAIDGPAVLYRGLWPTYFAAPFGVAAACARLFELDEARTAHALAIALALASPGVGRPAGAHTSRWVAFGNACANGVRAAFWAMDGFAGDLGIADGEFLSSVYNVRPDAAALVGGLGAASAVEETSFKPWCAARQTMAAAQAWTELAGAGFADDGRAEIRVGVPAPYLKMVDHGITPGERASYLTSLPYQLALAALEPDARLDVRQNPREVSQAVRDFMARVKVEPDEALLAQYPEAWPARVSVAGLRHVVLRVPGEPQRPWSERDVLAKFERYASLDIAPMCFGVLEGQVAPVALLARLSMDRPGRTAVSN